MNKNLNFKTAGMFLIITALLIVIHFNFKTNEAIVNFIYGMFLSITYLLFISIGHVLGKKNFLKFSLCCTLYIFIIHFPNYLDLIFLSKVAGALTGILVCCIMFLPKVNVWLFK